MIRNDVPTLACEVRAREAKIARDGDGAAIGAAIFFTPEELADMGIDPTSADAVELRIVNGKVDLQSVGTTSRQT